jgi:hypothetical protein
MRKLMLTLHLYGGLLCAPYLLIFGFSSLTFNHHFAFLEGKEKGLPTTWVAPLTVSPVNDKDAMAECVRDSLGLMGWPLPWKTRVEPSGDIEFEMERPGKSYKINTDLKNHSAIVEARRKGVWEVINSLHALGSVPNARFTGSWAVYTELCTAFTLFAGVSGIYLWVNSRRERRVGLITLVVATLGSFGLMFLVIFRG